MIVKRCEVPVRVLALEALLRRLPLTYPNRDAIEEEYRRYWAGYQGELSLNYDLSFLHEQDYYIFHDLRLQHENHYFQIDILLLSASFALIIEVKNYAGTIFFDRTIKQLIQTKNGIEKGFPDPILQVQKQRVLFEKWLTSQKFLTLPLESIVVITNPYTIIKCNPGNVEVPHKVIHRNSLLLKIEQLEYKFPQPQLQQKELKKLSKFMVKQHIPHQPNLLETYAISPVNLLKGVYCPQCSFLPMERKKSKWHCPKCFHTDKNSHIKSIQDYFLLIKTSINSRECSDFLQLSSRKASVRILCNLSLDKTGQTKDKLYHLRLENLTGHE